MFTQSGDAPLVEHSFAEDSDISENNHLFRLFVGWVPKAYTEQDLKPLFEQVGTLAAATTGRQLTPSCFQCGAVEDLIILKDKAIGQSRGCAFVSFATKEEAEEAISKLDRQVHLPGAFSSLEVHCKHVETLVAGRSSSRLSVH
jgi:CUG-BP- and ETR3-like factor